MTFLICPEVELTRLMGDIIRELREESKILSRFLLGNWADGTSFHRNGKEKSKLVEKYCEFSFNTL